MAHAGREAPKENLCRNRESAAEDRPVQASFKTDSQADIDAGALVSVLGQVTPHPKINRAVARDFGGRCRHQYRTGRVIDLAESGFSREGRAQRSQLQPHLPHQGAVDDVEQVSTGHAAGNRVGVGQESPYLVDGPPDLEGSMQTDRHAVSRRNPVRPRTGANVGHAVAGRQAPGPADPGDAVHY